MKVLTFSHDTQQEKAVYSRRFYSSKSYTFTIDIFSLQHGQNNIYLPDSIKTLILKLKFSTITLFQDFLDIR